MIRVLYFAACRERAGVAEERLPLEGLRLGDVLAALADRHPPLASVLPRCRVAIDQRFAAADELVADEAEVALIPPVAGGAVRAEVVDAPLSVDALIRAVQHTGAGAIVVMLGTVRDHAEGEGVTSLEYEAYAPMAERVICGILDEVEAELPGVRAAVSHRTGKLALGDTAVVVATSAPHRGEAFTACARVIDRLKRDAPIWKREHRESGLLWVGLGA